MEHRWNAVSALLSPPHRGGMVIARHFSAGYRRILQVSPGGTAERSSVSAVPPGLIHSGLRYPALKCRAISIASLWDAKKNSRPSVLLGGHREWDEAESQPRGD